jgi:hypothetical protein
MVQATGRCRVATRVKTGHWNRSALISLLPQRCTGLPPDTRKLAATIIGFVEA